MLALLALLLPVGVGTAQAQDAYRYWSYWWGAADGSWEYAQSGPADRVVSDGDVEGWLFLTSAEAQPTQPPSVGADFETLCPDGEPVAGQVRVGVVLDFGTEQDTPAGDAIPEGDNPRQECVLVPEGSTAEQALAAATDVRAEQGAVCGIAGYPATGCFEVVTASEATQGAAEAEESSGIPVWPIVGGAMVLAALVVLLLARTRKTT